MDVLRYPKHISTSVSATTKPKPTLGEIVFWCGQATNRGGAFQFVASDQFTFQQSGNRGLREMNGEGNRAGQAAGNAVAYSGSLSSCVGQGLTYRY
jgi:hypothetical protein